MSDQFEAPLTPSRHPMQPVEIDPSSQDVFMPPLVRTNPYKIRCGNCVSMLQVPLPNVHCPKCHHFWTAKRLTAPTRCPRCNFNLYKWRAQVGVAEISPSGARLT